jgi:hypothetical protein
MSSDTLASNLGCINIAPTARSHAQLGLQRSIALALNHVGFDSAAPDALQSFALAVETCQTAAHPIFVLRLIMY